MVHGAGVLRVLLHELEGVCEGPEVASLGHRLVVQADHLALGGHRVAGAGKTHRTLTQPHEIPVVAVRRVRRGHGGREVVEVHFGDGAGRVGSGHGERRIGIGVGRCCEGLRQGSGRQGQVAKLVLESHIPVDVVFEDESRGEVPADDPTAALVSTVKYK